MRCDSFFQMFAPISNLNSIMRLSQELLKRTTIKTKGQYTRGGGMQQKRERIERAGKDKPDTQRRLVTLCLKQYNRVCSSFQISVSVREISELLRSRTVGERSVAVCVRLKESVFSLSAWLRFKKEKDLQSV